METFSSGTKENPFLPYAFIQVGSSHVSCNSWTAEVATVLVSGLCSFPQAGSKQEMGPGRGLYWVTHSKSELGITNETVRRG